MEKISLNKTLAILVAVALLISSVPIRAQNLPHQAIQQQLSALEATTGGRLGIALIDTGTNAQLLYRGDERFPMCSTSKVMVVAAVLKQSEQQQTLLTHKLAIKPTDLVNYNPVTEKHVNSEMTVAELSAAALQYSDNTAMNKLLSLLGGTARVTQFARGIGDQVFRLDRIEPELNTAIPGDERDSTSPLAMAQSLRQLTLGSALAAPQRLQLVEWLKGNTTGAASIRAGLPESWVVGDKTGSGEYGTTNDIAIIWPEAHAPLILVTYFTQQQQDAKARKDVLAAATQIVTRHLQK